MRPLELAAHVALLVLVCIGIGSAIYIKCKGRRKDNTIGNTVEEAHAKTASQSLDRINIISPQLPRFKTRSSLSMSSSPTTPRTPRSPATRFAMTPPGRRSRKSGSIDSLPSVETVLEQYEKEAEAAERSDKSECGQILKEDGNLIEPGPSAVKDKLSVEKSAWDRPHIAQKTAGEA